MCVDFDAVLFRATGSVFVVDTVAVFVTGPASDKTILKLALAPEASDAIVHFTLLPTWLQANAGPLF
jgi:hypothetical protein